MAEQRAQRGRRGNGEGSAYFDKSKQLYYGMYSRADGTRGKTRGFDTETAALQKARDLEYEERNGLRPRDQNHQRSLADAIDAWVETIASQKETSTRGEYVRVANSFKGPFGRVSLEDLSRLDVQRYANAQRKTLRHGTVRKHITILQMVLRASVDWGWINTNVAERISIKADEDPIDIDGLTDDESDRLLAAAGGRGMEHLVSVGVWTGLRKGELPGLRWQDVGQDRLNVRQTLVWRSGQPWTFKQRPKTRAGRRSFPLLPVVAEARCIGRTPASPSFASMPTICGPSTTWSSRARSARRSIPRTSTTSSPGWRNSLASSITGCTTGDTPRRPRCSAPACPTASSWRSVAGATAPCWTATSTSPTSTWTSSST